MKHISAEVASRWQSLDAGLDAGSIVCITVLSSVFSEVNTHCFHVHKMYILRHKLSLKYAGVTLASEIVVCIYEHVTDPMCATIKHQ